MLLNKAIQFQGELCSESEQVLYANLVAYTMMFGKGELMVSVSHHWLIILESPSLCLCVQFCPEDISCTAQPFLTKLDMLVYYHEA